MSCVAFKASALALTCTSGLTLPSSGPAYGGPLKSNVRRQAMPHTVMFRNRLAAAVAPQRGPH
jgi:hypothetical protein